MANALKAAEQPKISLLEQVVIGGDLAKLTPQERITYYRDMCHSLGLNPLTKPFAYLTLNGRLVLYAQRDCTDQLRKINGVSVELTETKMVQGAFTVVAKATDKTGRVDSSTGAVWVGELKGEAMCNAMMKAETKAKRRVTLSICGLGLMDDSEVDSVPAARRTEPHDAITGEIDADPFPKSDNIGPEPELLRQAPPQSDEVVRAETWVNEAIKRIDECASAEKIEAWFAKNKDQIERAKAANEDAYDALMAASGYRKRRLLGAEA